MNKHSDNKPYEYGRLLILTASLILLLFSHPLVHGDGLAYFIILDSIAGDGDLDFRNQDMRFGHVNQYQIFHHPMTGELVTAFPFGSAFLLAPFYWLGAAIEPALPAAQFQYDHFQRIQGRSLAFSLTASLAALCAALLSVWFAYQTARRISTSAMAALAALACFIGTPLLFYATIEPLDSHVYGAMLIACALWLGARHMHSSGGNGHVPPSAIAMFALGLVLGMATLVRWQLVLYALPIWLLLLVRCIQRFDRQRLGILSTFTLGVGLFVSLCMTYFWLYFGSALTIPSEAQSGTQFISPFLHYLPQIIFDGQHGWLPWSPLAALGLIGLLGLVRLTSQPWWLIGVVCLIGIGLELALNASLYDWGGGWAYGQRRMTEAYAPLVLGTAWLLQRRGLTAHVFRIMVLIGLLLGLGLFIGYLYYTHTNAEHPDGNTIREILDWLLAYSHRPTIWEIFRERYGPWAWARPQL